MLKLSPQPAPLSIADYKAKAFSTNQFQQNDDGFRKIIFGYFGEIGGLLAAIKKIGRDKIASTEAELAGEELGDALWYLINIAIFLQIDIDHVGEQCIKTLRNRNHESLQDAVKPVTFRHIDSLLEIRRTPESLDRSHQLGILAYHAGSMANRRLTEYQSMANLNCAEDIGKHLSEIAICCASFDLKLEDVARSNLIKIHSRWPGEQKTYPLPFDEGFAEHERFPAKIEINFIERGTRENGHVVQSLNEVFIGDRLTDNSNEPDDYRFHDVFHLAYLAFLGWSPVLRGLLKRKRKSDPRIDENEDGARAAIIEEGIATWIFNHAKEKNFYTDDQTRGLDYGLLKQISSMVKGYEVEKCQLWQWEQAIIEGFKIFRKLQEHRGGIVTVDVLQHAITFTAPDRDCSP
ncbi:mazG nucleotide pyrophosphohydrolase domain protein [Delftia acidovorans]|uniref:nucleoside triphosphate pyrophosphohydrolase family protein n=1 Tax=Delftia acidovorans TaxID=80866 RepID=UPI0004FFA2BF|nr:nucleoside triphosphate pyrophosphohydrolase family protein [Delftia acidovorans]KFJ13124.1 mazG nucleotide pyrophosphohydrolase domain protein [Delftia acidovorans]QQB53326.1 nucleoside triphosphate pyrophosphohydrolase family protein [Delftia acidovorans]